MLNPVLAPRALSPHTVTCPHCLRSGPTQYACPGCWQDRRVLLARLNVGGFGHCACCHVTLRNDAEASHLGRCGYCGGLLDPYLTSFLPYRVIGLAGEAEGAAVRRYLGLPPAAPPFAPVRLRTPEACTWLVPLGTEPQPSGVYPANHLLANLSAIWIGGALEHPLALGQQLDALLRRSGFRRSRLKTLPVLVEAGALPSGAANLINSRFSQVFTCISLPQLLPDPPLAESLDERAHPVRVIGVGTPADLELLCQVLPHHAWRAPHPAVRYTEFQGQVLLVTDVPRLQPSPTWISRLLNVMSQHWVSSHSGAAGLEELLRWGRSRPAMFRRVTLCQEAPLPNSHPEDPRLTPFAGVRGGVSAAAALGISAPAPERIRPR